MATAKQLSKTLPSALKLLFSMLNFIHLMSGLLIFSIPGKWNHLAHIGCGGINLVSVFLSFFQCSLLTDLVLWRSLLPTDLKTRSCLQIGGGVHAPYSSLDHRFWFFAEAIQDGSGGNFIRHSSDASISGELLNTLRNSSTCSFLLFYFLFFD